MSILGNRVVRKEDPTFLTVGGTYVDDVRLDGAVYVTYVRSTMASACIAELDVSAALDAPGVIAVYTGDDLGDLPNYPMEMPGFLNAAMARPWLAKGVVRFVGEPVAAVVTEERYQGPDAAELVFVDYDPLPVVVDPEASLAGETLLFPDAGTNVAIEFGGAHDDAPFEACEVVVRDRFVNQRVAPCPMEVRASASRWDGDRLTHWGSTQGAHGVRDTLVQAFGLAPEQVRVISPDVGGGFGAKGSSYPDELFTAWIARQLGRPVRWVETRSESMVNLGHGRGQIQRVSIGGRRDGTIEAYRLEVVQDAGAYPAVGAILPFMTQLMAGGVYRIPTVQFSAKSVVTNTTPVVAYRGAGRPEAAAAIERAMDRFAGEIGMDPAEVRRKNLIPSDAFPYSTTTGATYDSGDYARALDLVLDAAGYNGLRAEQERRRSSRDPRALGIGLSVYVETTNPMASGEFGAVEVKPDGSAVVRTGTSPHGQGHVTAFAMVVSDKLGIPIDKIEVLYGDTDVVPRGGGTGGSRSLQVGGSAVQAAAIEVADQARKLAADLLEASVDDVVIDTESGVFHVAGTPAVSRTWAEVAATASEPLAAEVDFTVGGATFPFGAHLAVVEVDTETGLVRLERLVAVDDAGTVINPLLAEGQVHGGLAQGAAQALYEEFRYDEDGNPLTSNLADYSMISATELPSFETIHAETPTPLNPLGAKGIGESGTIGSTPAVQNAVVDALAHLGVTHLDMPTTPERIWRALDHA